MNIPVPERLFQHARFATVLGAAAILAVGLLIGASVGQEASPSRPRGLPLEQRLNSENWQAFAPPNAAQSGGTAPQISGPGELPKPAAKVERPLGEFFVPDLPARPSQYVTARFNNVNISAAYAADEWTAEDPKRLGPNAPLALVHQKHSIFIVLVAESLGVELGVSSETAAAITQNRLRREKPEVWIGNETPTTAAGIPGIEFEARWKVPGHSLYLVSWVAAHNGYAYEVATYGDADSAWEIKAAAHAFRDQLRLIDPQRVAHATNCQLIGCFRSPTFHYEMDLSGLSWISVADTIAKAPHIDFLTCNLQGTGIAVTAVPMVGKKPDMEWLKASMLAAANILKPGDEIAKTSPCRVGGLDGLEIEAQGGSDQEKCSTFFWLTANEHAAYLISSRVVIVRPEAIAALRQAIDRFKVDASAPIDENNLNVGQRDFSSQVLNQLGLRYFAAGDLVTATDYFRSAARLTPANYTVVENYVEVLSRLDRTDEAISFLDQHRNDGPEGLGLRAIQAQLQLKQGKNEASRKTFAKLFAEGFADENALLVFVRACVEAKSYDEALTAIDRVQQRKPTAALQTWQATLHSMKGEHAKAIALLKELQSRHPADVDIAIELVEAYDRAKQLEAGLAVTKDLISSGKKTEAVLLAQGQMLLQLQRTAEAKQVFEEALRTYPHSAAAKELLAIASSQLGEGQNSCVKTEIAAVEVPASIAQLVDRARSADPSAANDSGAEILSHVVGISYHPGKPLRKTSSERVRICTTAGVKHFSMLNYKFDAVIERIYVNKLAVFDESGTCVARGAVENYYVVDDTESGEATNGKVLKIPVPGLQPGYSLEYTVTRENVAYAKDFGFDGIPLASVLPCRLYAFFVQGDVNAIKVKASAGVRLERKGDLISAVAENPAPVRVEPYQPSADSFLPMVWVGPAGAEWKVEIAKYLQSIEDRLQLDEVTRERAAQLTQNCSTKADKLAAIVEHVQQSYTYHAIEFGRRARIPNKASKTIALQYGDCKDHALLTKQLLAAVGIESHLALVQCSLHVVEDMPSMDQFDHMVIYVPTQPALKLGSNGAGLIIDTTNKDSDPFLDPPCGLTEKEILVLDPAQPHFVHTAKSPNDAGQLVSKRSLTFDLKPTGAVDSRITEDVTLNGYLAPSVRGFLKRNDVDAQRVAIQNLLSQNGAVRVKRVDATNLEAVREPLHLHLEYVIPNSFHVFAADGGKKSLLGSLPCAWESEVLLTQALDSRKTPFEISTPKLIRSSLVVHVPEGYEFANIDQCSGSGQSKYRSWSAKAIQDGSTIRIDYAARIVAGRHAAKEYEDYYSDLNEALAVLQTPVMLQSLRPMVETARRPMTTTRVR